MNRKQLLPLTIQLLTLLTCWVGLCPFPLVMSALSETPVSWLVCLPFGMVMLLPLTRRPSSELLRGLLTVVMSLTLAGMSWFILPWDWNWTLGGRIALTVYGLVTPLILAPVMSGVGLRIASSVEIGLMLVAWFFTRMEEYAVAAPAVQTVGLVYLPLYLLTTNLEQMQDQIQTQRTGRPRGMLPANVLMTSGVVLLVLVLANIRAIWEKLEAAWHGLWRALAAFLALFRPEKMSGGSGEGAGAASMGALPPGEVSPFWKAMEIVVYVLGILAAAALLILFLRRLPKLLRRLSAWISKQIARYLESLGGNSAGYVDENVALPAEKLRPHSRSRVRMPRNWEQLPPAQQVRLVTGRVRLLRGAHASETARESLIALTERTPLADGLAASYDRARYSDHPVTDTEASQAREVLRAARGKHR